jgi:hypothetical protein
MKALQKTILLFFVLWWSLNFYFNLPDTSLPIVTNYETYKKWDGIFYQRWGFFAPPPDYDDRLYYVYTNQSDTTKVNIYEIFENIHLERNKRYLYDDDLSNLDYILHNLSSPIGDLIRESYEIYNLKGNCENLGEYSDCFQKYIDEARGSFDTSPNLTSLIKHSEIIAKKNNFNNHSVQIIFGAKELPKFKDRNNKNIIRKEYPFFKSNIYNLKTKKWKKYHE